MRGRIYSKQDNPCPTSIPSAIAQMTPVEALTLARDIHAWYVPQRRNKWYRDWDSAWVAAYETCLSALAQIKDEGAE